MDLDLQLVGKAREGDLDAFGDLVSRHQHRLVHFLRMMMSSAADREAAEDVAQEAFLRAFRSLGQFRGQSTFKTWLYQIATNVARTQVARRRDRKEDQEPETRPDRPSGENVERRVIAHDQLRRALAELPDDWREAVILRDIEGLEYREIADVLGIPMGTVESRIFRGRQRLKAALQEPQHD
ncbi:MAG: sigma-70 family RNA polymerase sigma factor [Acidobacteria bacterium]|nr:sigma-70 family RNA polymerase sigma factor [Acidobacteriota bacterium]